MSMTEMTTEELMEQQASETIFRVITNSQSLLFMVQSAYFLVARRFLGYNPNKSFSPFNISSFSSSDDIDFIKKTHAIFGCPNRTAMPPSVKFRFVLSTPSFKEALTKEMAYCGMDSKEIQETCQIFSGGEVAKMFHEQYNDEMMRYAVLHKGNGCLPKNWQSLI
ncbi:hypothetical protein [Aeromonas media]|uniref:hypothetical protein n=1 Tax=Aeromonas media TaxID=651 RepID=UPI003D246AF7